MSSTKALLLLREAKFTCVCVCIHTNIFFFRENNIYTLEEVKEKGILGSPSSDKILISVWLFIYSYFMFCSISLRLWCLFLISFFSLNYLLGSNDFKVAFWLQKLRMHFVFLVLSELLSVLLESPLFILLLSRNSTLSNCWRQVCEATIDVLINSLCSFSNLEMCSLAKLWLSFLNIPLLEAVLATTECLNT